MKVKILKLLLFFSSPFFPSIRLSSADWPFRFHTCLLADVSDALLRSATKQPIWGDVAALCWVAVSFLHLAWSEYYLLSRFTATPGFCGRHFESLCFPSHPSPRQIAEICSVSISKLHSTVADYQIDCKMFHFIPFETRNPKHYYLISLLYLCIEKESY